MVIKIIVIIELPEVKKSPDFTEKRSFIMLFFLFFIEWIYIYIVYADLKKNRFFRNRSFRPRFICQSIHQVTIRIDLKIDLFRKESPSLPVTPLSLYLPLSARYMPEYKYLSAFAVSALASNWERLNKPFNPLLGETYELCSGQQSWPIRKFVLIRSARESKNLKNISISSTFLLHSDWLDQGSVYCRSSDFHLHVLLKNNHAY
ncbi:UNVERIFIED_CONTAM: hypothetical protein NCL1_10014 [Trichonephila clavipes]